MKLTAAGHSYRLWTDAALSGFHVLETPIVSVSRDAEGAGHQLADDGGDMVAVLLFVHAILGCRRPGYVIDHRARRIELLGVLDLDAELLLDARVELVERPAHDQHSSGSAPPRVSD